MRSINDRLQEMTDRLGSNELFEVKRLGNEINSYIFDYDPEDEYIVRDYLYNYLLTRSDLNVKIFDIYDIIIDILKEQNYLNKVFEFEKTKGVSYVDNIISRALNIGSNNDLIIQKIGSEVKENQIIIITGVGKCYGIVRGHIILNNLQSIIAKNPLIMFYPGSYDGQTFKLFNILENGNYYRAFQFVSRNKEDYKWTN